MEPLLQIANRGHSALPLDVLAALTLLSLAPFVLVLTCVIMTPTFETIQRDAIRPYAGGRLPQSAFLDRASVPLRAFMLRQTKARDVAVFARVAHRPAGEPLTRMWLTVLIPAFVVGGLRSAFAIGVALYLLFDAIDLAVAAILMGLPI